MRSPYAAPPAGRPHRARNPHRSALAGLLAAGLAACSGGTPPSGLQPTVAGDGPMVRFEPLEAPEPEIPFPNDLATRFDADSPTGRRVNLGLGVPTALEDDLRRHYNELDGFGTFAPMWVSFSKPLDLSTVTRTSVLVVNIDERSPHFGELAPLDLGEGAYPVLVKGSNSYFPNDPRGGWNNFLFPPTNVASRRPGAPPEEVYDWEVETNTLILRPLVALRQASKYAVVLTSAVRGTTGSPVQSPFPWVNHAAQTQDLEPLGRALAAGGSGVKLADVAFTWAFTTQSVTKVLERVRQGLDAQGPMGWLAERVPLQFADIKDLGINHDGDGSRAAEGLPAVPRDTKFILQPALLEQFFQNPVVANFGGDANFKLPHVAYLVFGSFDTANFRVNDDRVFDIDPDAGRAAIGTERVTFMITVPKTTEKLKPPFPVALYAHGARTSRFEASLIADRFAEKGIAVMALDAVGHGPIFGNALAVARRELGDDFIVLTTVGAFTPLFAPQFDMAPYIERAKNGDKTALDDAYAELIEYGIFDILFNEGRTEDADHDGERFSGDSYFVPHMFRTRDAVRQTAIDYMVAVRILKSLDPAKVPAAIADPASASDERLKQNLNAGDFDADGVLDVGGPDSKFWAFGTSLGGINTSVLMAVEPNIRASVHIVNGGGWTDELARTTLEMAVDKIYLEVMGPVLVGCKAPPMVEGGESPGIAVTFNNDTFGCRELELGRDGVMQAMLPTSMMAGASHVEVTNVDNGEVGRAELQPGGLFSVNVAADAGDRLSLRVLGAGGVVQGTAEVVAKYKGLGRTRNTPRTRRVVGISQIALDSADPMSYARHLYQEPLEGVPPKRVLHFADPGDYTVPFATMVAWDRGVGLLGETEAEWRPVHEQFLAHESFIALKDRRRERGLEGLWDPDDLDRNNADEDGDGNPDRIGPLPLRVVDDEGGRAATRYHNADDHEYVCCPDQNKPIDWAIYGRNQLVMWFLTNGTMLSDDRCLDRLDVPACCAQKRERGEPIDAALQFACDNL